MFHSLEPTLVNLHGHYSRDLKPILMIASRDTVRYKTLDAGWSELEHHHKGNSVCQQSHSDENDHQKRYRKGNSNSQEKGN